MGFTVIDFVVLEFPVSHTTKIREGYKTNTTSDGVKTRTNHYKQLTNTNGCSVKVATSAPDTLKVVGSPLMFLQGQNLFGSDNLLGLCYLLFKTVTKLLGIKPTKADKRAWKAGEFDVHTVDVTHNFSLGNPATVSLWLDQAAVSVASGKQLVETCRASSSRHVETLYVGKQSGYVSVKFYDKHQLLLCQDGADPELHQKLVGLSRGLLRCEVRLHRKYLQDHGLRRGSDWSIDTAHDHFFRKVSALRFGSALAVPVSVVPGLSGMERLAYEVWRLGGDPRPLVSTSTWCRLVKACQGQGVDVRQPYLGPTGLPLADFLLPSCVAQPPAWLLNDPALFVAEDHR